MKIRVEYNYVKDCYKSPREHYEKCFNHDGILFHEETESIYYDVDFPIMPTEGQRLYTKFGICIVEYSAMNLHPNSFKDGFDYWDESLVIVRDE